ncbi:MAG: HAMP domain-containing protein [Planctomycetes bacterium]|nr:HAMP domain-containing protein [Planctomycetota bacterium]
MTLTNRLSAFFLGFLGLVLVGFSVSVFFLVRNHLYRQVDDRLEAALNVLVAAVEVRRDAVEWEPEERRLHLGRGAAGAEIIWLVRDGAGRFVDGSQPLSDSLLSEMAKAFATDQEAAKRLDLQDSSWQVGQRHVQPADGVARDAGSLVAPEADDNAKRFAALVLTAGVPLLSVEATLGKLGWALAAVSAGIWFFAFLVGRGVCRRALLPVHRMAESARTLDVTDRRQRLPVSASADELEDLARAFNNLIDRLQESFERQRRFTGDVSHQLRTPLAVILGQIEVALRRDRPMEEYQRVLTTVHDKALCLRKVVESLLYLARADHETRLPDMERLDLKTWLTAHLQTWSEHERAADLRVECKGDGPFQIMAQSVLLGELVNILLDNAVKWSPPESPITLQLGRDAQELTLRIIDQGYGIAGEQLPHVFEPFVRAAGTRQHGVEGAGLGLSIAKRLAEAFGGSLDVASQLGRGSCFTLRLRANNPQIAQIQKAETRMA